MSPWWLVEQSPWRKMSAGESAKSDAFSVIVHTCLVRVHVIMYVDKEIEQNSRKYLTYEMEQNTRKFLTYNRYCSANFTAFRAESSYWSSIIRQELVEPRLS